jgi:hypothetical protein
VCVCVCVLCVCVVCGVVRAGGRLLWEVHVGSAGVSTGLCGSVSFKDVRPHLRGVVYAGD